MMVMLLVAVSLAKLTINAQFPSAEVLVAAQWDSVYEPWNLGWRCNAARVPAAADIGAREVFSGRN